MRKKVEARHLRRVRAGTGANCSSIGSVVDTLFLGATVGGALVAAVLAALSEEPIRIVEPKAQEDDE